MILQLQGHCWTVKWILFLVVPCQRFSWVLLYTDADFTQCKASMWAIYIPSPPFLSHICRTTLAGTWSQSTADIRTYVEWREHFNTIAREGKSISKNTGTKLAAGNNYNWFPTSTATVSLCHGTSRIKKKCPTETAISGEKEEMGSRELLFFFESNTEPNHQCGKKKSVFMW